ncbi:RraA family protein [Tropicibacter naphthalenivorans]|uniref:Putative 4-hydroxy-4-methyl-2-oxoglutarate aldolase n=1 Tax=Tropicibacter naphthalenivorans TaxID=441103 RepID=A0A0P1G2R8_9RHOB|nr:aldolase [Tropicibacter naphthalenivorans]CUH75991.1 4-hydroxy-2-oxoglutarate aldolase [Tropicibacter naphthalenivorans]SMC40714.1 Regulator of RNase E activity RraA [Tropicibacter naphthalenivorans]
MIEDPAKLTLIKNAPRPTQAQIDAFAGIPTGFVCDAMDGMGALATAISPLTPAQHATVHGPALVADNGPAEILATLAAVHMIQPGDVVVAAVQGHQGCSASGDQLMGMMVNAGAAGFVTDGPMRDVEGIELTGMNCWCTGLNPASPYAHGPGTVGGAAAVGGRIIATGDMIIADRNGVVVVPYARIDEVIAKLEDVKKAEIDLETKVKSGFKTPLDLDAMLADGTAKAIG